MALKSYRELEDWQAAIDLVEQVYRATQSWPDSERFGLVSQARRAASSVPANIAEGYGRRGRREYVQHLYIARGSLLELETHLIIAVRLGYSPRDDMGPIWTLAQRVGKMLNMHIRALRGSARRTDPDVRSPEPGTRNPEPDS